jgi:glutathione synthase
MSRKLRLLVLTDHLSHNSENSLYALCTALIAHPDIAAVHVASRGHIANAAFFAHGQSTLLQAWPLRGAMRYEDGARRFVQRTVLVDARDYDWIWLRLPRPIPPAFFAFLREAIGEAHIFNRPSGIEETSTKQFLTHFQEYCPPIRLCQSVEDIRQFQEQFPIVLKPVQNYGGRGIVKVSKGYVYENRRRLSFHRYLPVLEKQLNEEGGYLAMEYLRNVRKGDKRIIVVGSEIIGAVLRLPPKGSWLCNAAQGGQAAATSVDEREWLIAQKLIEALAPRGILMFGIDTLVSNQGLRILSEVNTLSVGGLKPLQELSGKPVVQRTADLIAEFMRQGESVGSPGGV